MVKLELKNKESIRISIAENGMSIRSFSKYIGISQGYLSQILKGVKYPSPTVGFKIAKGLNVNISDIFFVQSD